MSSASFEKGIVTCTFLVTLADIPPEELQRLPDGQHIEKLRQTSVRNNKQLDIPELPDIKDDPQFWATFAVDKLFGGIVEKTRPQGVVLNKSFLDKDSDVPHVAEVRQKIMSGEMPGQLVTVRLVFTRPAFIRPDGTHSGALPFPGLTWLTSQIPLEPASGFALLSLTAAQIPA